MSRCWKRKYPEERPGQKIQWVAGSEEEARSLLNTLGSGRGCLRKREVSDHNRPGCLGFLKCTKSKTEIEHSEQQDYRSESLEGRYCVLK